MDWERIERVLTEGSDVAIRTFLERHAIDTLCAFGYVFEFSNHSAQFDLCANTRATAIANGAESDESTRWNSGEYQFPAQLLSRDELGPEWIAEYARIDAEARNTGDPAAIRDRLIETGCRAMAELALRGVFGDWHTIDFNVASLDCDPATVKVRDRHVRELIAGTTSG